MPCHLLPALAVPAFRVAFTLPLHSEGKSTWPRTCSQRKAYNAGQYMITPMTSHHGGQPASISTSLARQCPKTLTNAKYMHMYRIVANCYKHLESMSSPLIVQAMHVSVCMQQDRHPDTLLCMRPGQSVCYTGTGKDRAHAPLSDTCK